MGATPVLQPHRPAQRPQIRGCHQNRAYRLLQHCVRVITHELRHDMMQALNSD
jgi:hypothetical protein